MKGIVAGQTIAVEGLAELNKVFAKLDKATKKEMRDKLKSVGKIVADEAKSRAQARGLVKSGKLIRQIRPQVRTRAVVVEATALKRSPAYPSGYNYPKRYEYEKDGARAFMRPALEAKQSEVIDRFEEIFDELSRIWGGD